MGYSPWGHKESDMTKQLTQTNDARIVHDTILKSIKEKPFSLSL